MHEWAIASGIVGAVEEFVKKGSKPSRIEVILGELQNIDLEVLKEYVDRAILEISPRTEIIYKIEEVVFTCRSCDFEWRLDNTTLSYEEMEAIHFIPEAFHAYVKCLRCGSRDIDVKQGRGVKVRILY